MSPLNFLVRIIPKRVFHQSYFSAMSETSFELEKERSLSRSDSERRTSGTVELSSVDSWEENYKKNKNLLVQQPVANFKQRFNISEYPVNPDFNKIVTLWRGDITKLMIDGIVNAANNKCLGGGGVDGAIHRAAGSSLLDECRTLNGCATGDAKITGGYKLPAKYVIHTVGPIGEKPDLLRSCYEKSLNLAITNNIRSIAFPCISTGIYGYPQSNAAVLVLKLVRDFLEENSSKFDRIIFCLFLKEDVTIYESLMQLYFPVE